MFSPKTPIGPATSTQQQIKLFDDRGLVIKAHHEQAAIEFLHRVGYYRLTGYALSLQSQRDVHHPGVDFETLIQIYDFDSELRSILFELIGLIEISFRRHVSHHLAHLYDPFAHLDNTIFSNQQHYSKFTTEYNAARDREIRYKSKPVMHNINKYGELPIWCAVEILTISQVSKLYGNLNASKAKKRIAAEYGVPWEHLKSWLEHLSYVRNVCAHHDRLYDKYHAVCPRMTDEDCAIANTTLFATFVILARMQWHANEQWAVVCGVLYDEIRRHSKVDIGRIGFPPDWYEQLSEQSHPLTTASI